MEFFLLFLLLGHALAGVCLAESSFYHKKFRVKVDDALKAVSTVLDTTRHPVLPEDSDHTYADKYELVDVMTNTAIASTVTVFEKLGLDQKSLKKVLKSAQKKNRPVTLQFQMNTECTFDKQTERKMVVSETEVERSDGGDSLWSRMTTQTENIKVKRTVQEYHWKVAAPYELVLKFGDEEEMSLQSRDDMATSVVVTGGYSRSEKRPPPPVPSRVHDFTVDLTWLFQNIALQDDLLTSDFSIDRLSETCKTPRRNEQVEDVLEFRQAFEAWKNLLMNAFLDVDKAVSSDKTMELSDQVDNLLASVFSPIIPLFENSTVLPQSDFDLFLSKHGSSLDEFIRRVQAKSLSGSILSEAEVVIVSLLDHLDHVFSMWQDSVDHVEDMLRKQLVQAIGKELTAKDFDEFLGFYSRKIFGPDYAPKPFSYAIRRKNHYPDGMMSVESKDKGKPIDTTVRRIAGSTNPPISIPVDAATSVEIQGDRFIHGWIQHRWDGDNSEFQRTLVARAHQFSSFIVVLGVMGGSNSFIPKEAIILQNKDEVLIPLLSNPLPSAKEFKDSIASLSPEQRAFAEAYRQMQLESSVFGICIIQIKPQLERLLNLPEDALTKEIQLTQDLLSLFVEYQIPSDLLSFDGSSDASVGNKVSAVKGYTKAVMDVIENTKKKQLEEEKEKARMREKMEMERLPRESTTSDDNYLTMMQQQSMPRLQQQSMMKASTEKLRKVVTMRKSLQSNTDSASVHVENSLDSLMAAPPPELKEGHTEQEPSEVSNNKDKRKTTPFQSDGACTGDDFTLIPKILDAKFEQNDKDGALKSTIIQIGPGWSRLRQENLLVAPKKGILDSQGMAMEKNKAMDLLTAISRSGSLPVESSELHVIVAVSHCFEKQIMETIIRDNINPIEKMERSMKMIASVIHDVAETELLAANVRKKEDSAIEDKGIANESDVALSD